MKSRIMKIKGKGMNERLKTYRQGDVLLVALKPSLARGIRVGRDLMEGNTKRVVLANGEVTGHSHVVLAGKKTGHLEFFEALEELDTKNAAPILRITGRAAELRHEEHGTILLPVGAYRLVRQREYAPEEIRTVVD